MIPGSLAIAIADDLQLVDGVDVVTVADVDFIPSFNIFVAPQKQKKQLAKVFDCALCFLSTCRRLGRASVIAPRTNK